jgi:hypothetical protein
MARELKHTPGPWQSEDENGIPITSEDWSLGYEGCGNCVGSLITDSDGTVVAQAVLVYRRDEKVNERLTANARLIAAAPEMLDALERVQKFLADITAFGDEPSISKDAEALQDFITPIINKPKGKQ